MKARLLLLAVSAAALTVFRAEALPPVIDLHTTNADLHVYGVDANDVSGWAVAAGDFNGDGTDDLFLGAPDADGSGTGTSCGTGQVGNRCNAGNVYIVYGAPSLSSPIDLSSTTANVTVYGKTGRTGKSLAVGDINGDGKDDLIIGAPDDADAGRTYVIYGSSSPFPPSTSTVQRPA